MGCTTSREREVDFDEIEGRTDEATEKTKGHTTDKAKDHTTKQLIEPTTDQTTKGKGISVQKLLVDDIKEELCDTRMGKRIVFCDICLFNDSENEFGKRDVKKIEGVCICYGCNVTLCDNCVKGHENHELCVRKESEERESVEEKLISDLMREKRRMDKLEEENVCIYDRVNVKHELDQKDCYITGFCGLDNSMWVVCDKYNSCIKIFECGSNVLLRYIRIGSEPQDVTEIKIKHDSTVPDSASSSISDISVTNSTNPEKQCLLAVTLPGKRHILFIDVNKTPALKVRNVQMEKVCYGIEFCDDKIFTLCKESPILPASPGLYVSPMSVYVLSTDGVHLSAIQTGFYSYIWPHLAVAPERIYVTDWDNNKIKCIHVDGRLISEIAIEGSGPAGISVDQDHNVYVNALYHNKIYKLDSDLDGPPQPLLLDQSTDYMESPKDMCFYKDKLFVSHMSGSSLQNITSVVRLV